MLLSSLCILAAPRRTQTHHPEVRCEVLPTGSRAAAGGANQVSAFAILLNSCRLSACWAVANCSRLSKKRDLQITEAHMKHNAPVFEVGGIYWPWLPCFSCSSQEISVMLMIFCFFFFFAEWPLDLFLLSERINHLLAATRRLTQLIKAGMQVGASQHHDVSLRMLAGRIPGWEAAPATTFGNVWTTC